MGSEEVLKGIDSGEDAETAFGVLQWKRPAEGRFPRRPCAGGRVWGGDVRGRQGEVQVPAARIEAFGWRKWKLSLMAGTEVHIYSRATLSEVRFPPSNA